MVCYHTQTILQNKQKHFISPNENKIPDLESIFKEISAKIQSDLEYSMRKKQEIIQKYTEQIAAATARGH